MPPPSRHAARPTGPKALRRLTALAAALPLAACISFGAEPPPTLMTLTAETPITVGTAKVAGSTDMITILVPSAPQTLMPQRVPVQTSPTRLEEHQSELQSQMRTPYADFRLK